MKRKRSRPDGVPRKVQRRRCLRCGRMMSKGYRPGVGNRQWACRRCGKYFLYAEGVLVAVAGRAKNPDEWWESHGGWCKIPEGMLLTYGGEE